MTRENDRPALAGRRQVLTGLATGAAALGVTAVSGAAAAQMSSAQTGSGRLAGKVAFVTGGARGIGRVSALAMAREGADVVLYDLAGPVDTVPYPMSSPAQLAEAERDVRAVGRRCIAIRGDVRDMAALRRATQRAVDEFGRLDIVLANAGVLSAVPLAQMTDQQWADNIDIDLTGAANTIRAGIPHLVQGGRGGRIIAISSDLGRRGAGGLSHYCAAKWGVIGLVKAAAQELAPNMITANAICPGLTRTGMSQNASTFRMFAPDLESPTPEQVAPIVERMNAGNGELPIAWLEPEDIANAVVFLASSEGRYVTGTAIDVTAGKSSGYSA